MRSYNELFCSLAMEEFARLGVENIFIAPGSRSTPLALAADENKALTTHVHCDERGLAYWALGCSKATQKPVVVITTSGTATANLYPAIIEAELTQIPLIICTADRPSALRNTGANQVIDQVHMFNHTKIFYDLPVPSEQISAESLLTTIDEATFKATGIDPGPVHLNWQFQEPLVPPENTNIVYNTSERLKNWLADNRPYTINHPPRITSEYSTNEMAQARNGLIIIGSHTGNLPIEKLLDLDWPVIVDIQNSNRFNNHKNIISNWDLILEIKNDFNPDLTLHFGGPLTSKNGLDFCKNLKGKLIQIHPYSKRLDPHHNIKTKVTCEYQNFINDLPNTHPSHELYSWQQLNIKVQNFLNNEFESNQKLSEPFVAFALTKYIKDSNLFLSSSRPIRDAERYGIANSQNLSLFSNRGASGIDGNIATIAGLAFSSKPTVGIIGDLASLHDLNSLALLKKASNTIALFVVNNDGGGIFSYLPVSSVKSFEKYWGTPHGLNFKSFAKGFGVEYLFVETKEQLFSAIDRAKNSNKLLVEINTSRTENIEYQKKLITKLKEL